MTWNYRIVTYEIPDAGYELREVYYDDEGRENGSCAPFLRGETPEEVIATLELALKDARERPVFTAPASWWSIEHGQEDARIHRNRRSSRWLSE